MKRGGSGSEHRKCKGLSCKCLEVREMKECLVAGWLGPTGEELGRGGLGECSLSNRQAASEGKQRAVRWKKVPSCEFFLCFVLLGVKPGV